MVIEQSENIINEVKKAFTGKDEIIKKVLMAIYAGGHILLEDHPGMGKTTLAIAFSRALGLGYNRIQFTSDTLPSDITGYTVYNKRTDQFEYVDGAVNCNLLLADEINRTSPKTQSALLQAMAEYSITVDGKTHDLPKPFICIATENPLGTIGTQALPESQLDRFMIRLSIGYPSTEDQFEIIRARKFSNPIEKITPVVNATKVIETQNYISSIKISDEVLLYLIKLCEATRNNEYVDLGISPRGIMALTRMAKVNAIFNERTYVIPEDIQYVFFDVCEHRIELKPQAKITSVTARNVLESALEQVQPPKPNVR